jgi:hypothetical protein
MSCPLSVLNEVSVTTAKTGIRPFPATFVSMHMVPANMVLYFPSSLEEYIKLLNGNGDFVTGILSPVSIASFITVYPFNTIKSQGAIILSVISTMSPGTSSNELIITGGCYLRISSLISTFPFLTSVNEGVNRKTSTLYSVFAIF